MVMVLAMSVPAFADGAASDTAGTYTITIKNSNTDVSIKNRPFSAYKLFETRYVKEDQALDTAGDSGVEDENAATTVYGLDQTPHAYYIQKGSPFFDLSASGSFVETKTANGVTTYEIKSGVTDDTTGAKDSSIYQILKYFKLTEMPGQDSTADVNKLVLVEPKDGFDASQAYQFSQAMAPIIEAKKTALASWKADRTSESMNTETAVIDTSALGAGYYLVTGDGLAKKEDGTFDATKVVTAAVALTTTDPAAEIIAKIDAPKVEKEIDETGTPKYNNKAIGDTVPYVVTSDIPNMSGYENYFFILNDTLSKGLKLNDDADLTNDNGSSEGFVVTIKKADGTEEKLTRAANYGVATGKSYYVVKDEANNSFEVVFHDFIQYKGTLVTKDNYQTIAGAGTALDQNRIGTFYSEYENATITIKYSATVTEDAKIGSEGNVNTAKIEFSNKPDGKNGGKPGDNDRPGEGEGFDDVTDISPESNTVTYVSGLKVLKYTGDAKKALAGAEFTLVGQNLKNLVVESKEVYRAPTESETADIYEMTGNRFTATDPTPDKIIDKDGGEIAIATIDAGAASNGGKYKLPAYAKIQHGTLQEYVGFDATNSHKVTVETLNGDVDVYLDASNITKHNH